MSAIFADIESLKLFRRALRIFVGQQGEILRAVEHETERTYQLLEEEEQRCREEIAALTSALLLKLSTLAVGYLGAEILADTQDCLMDISDGAESASGSSLSEDAQSLMDFVPGISDLKKIYDLYQATERLNEIEKMQKEVKAAAQTYQRVAHRWDGILQQDIPQAEIFLGERVDALEAYYMARLMQESHMNQRQPMALAQEEY